MATVQETATELRVASPVMRLPQELLFDILEMLPTSSAVTFCVTHKGVKNSGGKYYIEKLVTEKDYEQRAEFLKLLARDLPDQVGCGICGRLHAVENALEYFKPSDLDGPAPQTYSDHFQVKCIHLNFSNSISPWLNPTRFNLLIKASQLGRPEFVPKLLLRCLAPKGLVSKLSDTESMHRREDFRIDDERLLHRLQFIIGSSTGWGDLFNREEEDEYSEKICPHLLFHSRFGSPAIEKVPYRDEMIIMDELVIWSMRSLARGKAGSNYSGLIKCNFCATECCVNVEEYTDKATVLFFTRWKDLGSSANETQWKRHLLKKDKLAERETDDNKGPRVSFEEGPEFQYDSLWTPKIRESLFRDMVHSADLMCEDPQWFSYVIERSQEELSERLCRNRSTFLAQARRARGTFRRLRSKLPCLTTHKLEMPAVEVEAEDDGEGMEQMFYPDEII